MWLRGNYVSKIYGYCIAGERQSDVYYKPVKFPGYSQEQAERNFERRLLNFLVPDYNQEI